MRAATRQRVMTERMISIMARARLVGGSSGPVPQVRVRSLDANLGGG